MLSHIKKLGIGALLAIFVFLSTIGTFAYPEPAKAQFVVTEAASVPQTVKTILEKVWEGLKVGVLNVVSTAVSYGLRKIAYDSAVWIASGGKGQGALVFKKGFADYLKDVGNDAIGHGIDALERKWGTSLCKIPNPEVDLALRQSLRLGLGITETQDPTRKPSCTLTTFYENNLSGDAWKSRYNAYSTSIQNQFNQALSFDLTQGDLGIQMESANVLLRKVAEAKEGNSVDVLKAGGTKDLTSKVSGQIKLPASSVRDELEGVSNKERVNKSEDQINTAISTGEFKLLPGALASFFLNTLGGQLLKNFQEKGILPFGLGCVGDKCPPDSGDSASQYESLGQIGGRRAAQAFFNEFLTARPKTIDEYNILGELNNCPDNPGLYNCRADDGFVQAAQEFSNGSAVTLKEAVDQGMFHGDWKLIPPIRAAENSSTDCYKGAYCHSNVKVLRQLRILPLGFEIAAEQSDPDKPWTLKQVMDGFTDCDYIRNGQGEITGINYSPTNKPFCHLIDPNWVIKAPATRCNAKVYGSNLLTRDAPDRMEDCADLTSCVAYNKDGTCVNYAYCTRERNTWKFNADQCSAQFRTCKAFTNEAGQVQSYVYRSLDTSFCSKDNVGCKTYSLSQGINGWSAPVGPNSYDFTNNGIFFNKNVVTTCGANSLGCSAYKVASSPSNLLYLRQAPEYLKCYDANLATPQIEWPKTVADLAKLQPSPACKGYASACIPDEVECNWYTPANSPASTKIPGRFTKDDVCDAKCVGYDAYREMPSNYSNGESITYIIPSSGTTCQAQEAGCSAFTNLSSDAGGLEKVEYFSYLRSCSKPDPTKEKTFITYEGSVDGGFQLKTFKLVKDATGGPEYFYRTQEDLRDYGASCNEAAYKAGGASLDCRQFNDEQGKAYYRLLSKTIPVSDSCTPYRLSNPDLEIVSLDRATCEARKGFWNNNQCNVCFQNGEYRDGSCFYEGLPEGTPNTAGASTGCTKEVDSCRAYKGNGGNNIREIFTDSFENPSPQVLASWKGNNLGLSPESTRVGEHSLGYNGGGEIYKELTLTPGKSYDLTFWAKGNGPKVTVILRSADKSFTKDFGSVGVGDVWNYYRLGPIELSGTTTSVQLVFKNEVNGRLFLDNVNLKEVSDLLYLVKNSLKVDPVCDSNLNDNLPGEALGCTAYKDPNNRVVNLTGFSQLCREGAIGCTALLNTYNTINDEKPRAYNVWLAGRGNTKQEIKVGTETFACQILPGETGCYTNVFGHTAQDILTVNKSVFVTSTVYIPGDTPSSSPVYLVANQQASCNAVDLGCTYAGTENISPTGPRFITTTVKNDPALYENSLCQKEAVGCSAYTGASGNTYFKNPTISGQRICTYRTDVTVNNARMNGWFWKDVGVCSNDKTKNCTASRECGGGNICQNIGEIPCYSKYIIEGNEFGLWSYGDKGKYENYVGTCPEEQDQCTEYADHNDGSRKYYFLKNDKLSAGNCDGSVSQREGCALFDQTDNPNKFWVTKDTYRASELAQFKAVKPIDGTDKNPGDANAILKVQLDRECGEWLQCRSSYRVWDSQAGKWKNVCEAIGRCKRAPENAEEDNISNCAEWVEEDPVYSNQTLSASTYVQRDISWKGMDFSGYSLLNIFPLETLSQVNFGEFNSKPDWRLARLIACDEVNCAPGASPDDATCKVNGFPCGKGGQGVCVHGACVQKINGDVRNLVEQSPSQTCRAYPEKDSPFPNTTFIDKTKREFERANICGETGKPTDISSKAYACECDYTKVRYGEALTKYWSYIKPHTTEEVVKGSKNQVPAGICLGGSRDGAACDSDLECYKTKTGKPDGDPVIGPDNNKSSDGSCQKSKGETRLLGWRGFCLEQDEGRNINGEESKHPCLTWLPVDHLAGTPDLGNQHDEAGYRPPANTGGVGGALYCLVGNNSGGPNESNAYPAGHILTTRTSTFDGAPPNARALDIRTDDGQNGRDHFDPTIEESKLTQFDIEKITLRVVKRDAEDPKEATIFELWPNDRTTPLGQPQGKFTTKDHDNDPGHAVTGKYLGHDNQYILMYGSTVKDDALYLDEAGKVCYPAAQYNEIVDSWEGNQNNCWDLSGNIFTSLTSRKGGGAFNGPLAPPCNQCRVPAGPYTPTEMGPDGLWAKNNDGSWRFDEGEICRSYGPRDGGAASHGGNWHAIRFRFSDTPERKFLGYDTFYCDQSPKSGGIAYEVSFKLRQWCSAVADVNSDPSSLEENTSPWTNRLWKPGYVIGDVDDLFGGWKGLGYMYNMDHSPFASIGLNKLSQPSNPVLLTPFRSRADCKGDGKESIEKGLSGCEFSDEVKQKQPHQEHVAGGPYSCPNGLCTRTEITANKQFPSAAASESEAAGKGWLARIFARVKKVLRFDGAVEGGKYKGYTLDSSNPVDVTETANKIPKVPWVFPVAGCVDDKCIEDNTAPGVTVNNVTDKDVRMPTPSGRVFMRFFAFADSDQMPLRNVKVIWGDEKAGEPIEGLPGLFRNHRGYKQPECKLDRDGRNGKCIVGVLEDAKTCGKDTDCGVGGRCMLTAPGSSIGKCLIPRETGSCETTADCQLVSTCVDETKAQNFGQIIDKTCDNNFIQFTHVYNCAKGGEGWEPDTTKCDGRDANSSAFPRGCCIFTPRVQVTDNWGWCNGKCGDGASPGGEGCYNGFPNNKENECKTDAYNASVKFKGRIILAPPLR